MKKNSSRSLAKINYHIRTNAIKDDEFKNSDLKNVISVPSGMVVMG